MSAFAYEPFHYKGNYIDGRFRVPENPEGAIRDVNPGDPADVIAEFPWQADHVEEAVAAARRAFPAWRDTPQAERSAALERYAAALGRHKERLAQAISRDMGKTLWEARSEVASMINKVPITLNEGLALVAPQALEGGKGWVRYKPHGVLAVIGPFNFPGHLPNGHIVPALATGNTVVFKTASHTPAVAQIMAECAHEAGLPPGVFNMVQVPGRHTDRLVTHREVNGVLFTGSTEVGERIQRLIVDQWWKFSALEMGGKNAAIVLDDADFDLALYEVLTAAFLTSGQRCTTSSRVILQRGIADRFAERLAEATRKLKVGVQHDPEAFMGPLVDHRAAEEFHDWQAVARQEGAEALVEGGLWADGPVAGGAYVRPSVHRVAKVDHQSRYQREELFAPDTCLYTVDTLEEAIALAEDTDYGLVSSIFSRDRAHYEKVLNEVTTGVVNWNRSTVGATSKLPFGGMKRSGNGHPAAVFSTLYCTYPVASLEEDKPYDPDNLLPGVHL